MEPKKWMVIHSCPTCHCDELRDYRGDRWENGVCFDGQAVGYECAGCGRFLLSSDRVRDVVGVPLD